MPADHKLTEYWPLDEAGMPIAKLYAQKHNPFVYFSDFVDSAERMAKLLPDDGFAADLQGGLTRFTWISPDECHGMHGISAQSAAKIGKSECGYPKSGLDHSVILLGDDYLRDTVGAIRSSPIWKDDTAIIIVWDEDDYAGAAGIKGSPIGGNGVVLGGSRAPAYGYEQRHAGAQDRHALQPLQSACDARSRLWAPLPWTRLWRQGRADRRLVRLALA